MKQFFLLLAALVCFAAASAQFLTPIPTLPAFYNYQGVARNSAGVPLANQRITVYSYIRNAVRPNYGQSQFYREKRAVTTNEFGLFSFQIGSPGADSASGTFFSYSALADMADFTDLLIHTEIVLPGTTTHLLLPDTKLATVPYAQYALGSRPWRYTLFDGPYSSNNTIYPDAGYWRLGLGTTEAAEKLHVVGKIRMEDGTQASGYVMTSDSNGSASWKPLPPPPTYNNYFNLAQNSIGVGINSLSLADTTRGLSIGTSRVIGGGPGLWVDGPLRFTNTGYFGAGSVTTSNDGDVLTSDAQGFARWKPVPSGPWSTGPSTSVLFPGNVIKPTAGLNLPVLVNTKMVVQPSNPLGGTWGDPKNYPLAIANPSGTNGVSISLNGGVEHDRKYIAFFENTDVKGRIEGQNLNDLRETPEWITNLTISSLQGGEFAAEAAACAFQFDLAEVAVLTLQIAIWAADFGTNLNNLESSVGITYASGSGDYAEWLERANPSDKFTFGDIVSVKGGKITKDLSNGGQLMVISRAPIVLGNMPEKAREALYEKVAFIGQVPVKVQGAVAVGDYIVANAGNSGVGYGVHPDKITTEEYSRIVGVAWQASKGSFLSTVNTAIGVNTAAANSIIKKQEEKIAKQEDKIALLENQFNQLSAYLQSKDPSYQYTKLETKPVATTSVVADPLPTFPTAVHPAKPATFKMFSSMSAAEQIKFTGDATKDKIRKLINEKPEYFDAAMKAVKEKLQTANPGVDLNPEMKRLLNDRAFFIASIKKAYNL